MVSLRAMVASVIAPLFGGLLLQGCGSGGGGSGGGGAGGDDPITSVAEKTADLSTLVAALKAAGLVDTLSGKGPFTVFAPGNAAFTALPASELKYLLHDKAALTKVLEYHVASGSVLSSALKNGEKIKTLEGADVNVTITKKGDVTTVMIDKATVTTADVKATNGVVHIINQVLIPPGFSVPSIPAVATAAGLKTLVTAVTAAKLGSVLSGNGPFTVFAPTDDAFNNLPKGVLNALLKPENIKDLQKVLEYHVVASEVAAADLKNGEHVKTLEGQDVNVTISGSSVSIDNAKVIKADVYAGNGIVHVIDAVMLPPGFTPPAGAGGDDPITSVAEKTADLSTLVTALKAAGLVDTLSGKGPFTVFAPGNAAFTALPSSELKYLLHDKAALTKVLEYHVASGSVLSSALKNGEKIKTLEGADVNVTITKKGNVTTVMIDKATVTTADVKATNGVVHIINQILIPPGFSVPSIPAVATTAGLKTLVTAVTAAKLGSVLSGNGPFTVFAPTDDAFNNLPKGVLNALLKPENIKDLQKVLEYHVVASEVAAADLKNGEHVKTLEGQDVNVTISGSSVSIDNAKVIKADVYAGNGIVHVIDAVMLPPGFTPPAITSLIVQV